MEPGIAKHAPRRFIVDTRGGGIVEYLVVAGVVATVAIVALTQLGEALRCKVEAESAALWGTTPSAACTPSISALQSVTANAESPNFARKNSPDFVQQTPNGPRGVEENRGPHTLPNVTGNCLSYALGLDEAVPHWRQTLDPNWPQQYMPSIHCAQIACNDNPDCTSRNKIVIFVDPEQHDNFHAMRQQCNGLWVSKNGDDPPVADLPGPPIDYYKSIYPPKGQVQTTCWSCPNPLF